MESNIKRYLPVVDGGRFETAGIARGFVWWPRLEKMELDEIDGENGDIVACSWIGIGWVFGGLALLVYRQNETVLDFSKLNRLWHRDQLFFFFF